MASVFYRDHEEAAMITQVKDAFCASRGIPGAKVFKSSFSSSLRAYDKKTAISRLETWCAWHSAWVYNEEPPSGGLVVCFLCPIVWAASCLSCLIYLRKNPPRP